MKNLLWKCFELVINYYQGFIMTWFVYRFLNPKSLKQAKTFLSIFSIIFGTTITLLNHITLYEGFTSTLYLVILLVYAIIAFNDSIIKKLLYRSFCMKTNGGFLVTKIKQLGDRIFEKILSEKNIDAFNGAQGRILYVLWQEDGISIRSLSTKCGLAITSLTTMLERMENQGLISRVQSETDKRKTLLFLTEKAHALKGEYDSVSDEMGSIYYKGFSEEEITRFEECLDRIRKNLEEWQKS